MYRNKIPSRKQTHIRNQMIGLGIGILIVVVYLAVFGLNSVIQFSVWVGNLVSGNANTQVVENQEDFYGALFVDDLPRATNSAELIVSGNSSNFETLTYKINDKIVKTQKVGNQDNFTEVIGDLKEGENAIQVIAQSAKSKEKRESDPQTIIYKKNKPKLTVSEPANDATVKKQEVLFKGETDEEVSIEVDGAPAITTATGTWESRVRLKEGDNTIAVTAVDEAGNEEKIEIKIKYEKED